MSVTRRPIVLSALAIAGVGMAAGIAVEAPRLLRKRIHSPYDDITGQIPDQDQAAKVGRTVIASLGKFEAAKAANSLRTRNGTLAELAKADLKQGKMLEAGGWVLPESLALACAIVADQTEETG